MQKEFTVAITGDTILNRKISVIDDERFLSLIKVIRDADVGYTHLETLIHDYDGPEVYPAAEGGNTWMRSPRFAAEEIKWAGFDIVSHAFNHALDYSYGGLYSTWKALDEAGLPYAGTGKTLGEARAPAYVETSKGRVALISMTASFSRWARAGNPRPDMKGRPGVNPLRHYYMVDAQKMEQIKQLAKEMGLMIRQIGNMWFLNPPGLHMELTKFVVGDQPGVTAVADEDDVEGNLRSVKDARRQADYVIVHIHNHAYDYHPDKGASTPSKFIPPFARACIDAGADIVMEHGGEAPIRGMELYKNKPIFYDVGGFILMSNTVSRLPDDFYQRPGFPDEARSQKATPADGYDARQALPKAVYPPGYTAGAVPIKVAMVPVCSFGKERKLTGIKLYPVTHTKSPRSQIGIPLTADTETSKKFFEYLAKVSSPMGTRITFKEGIGHVDV